MTESPESAPNVATQPDEPNRAEVVLGTMTAVGKKILVFVSVALAMVVFTIVVWFTFGTMWVGQIVKTTADNTFKGFGFGLALGLILVYFALWMLRLAIMRKMPGAGRIAFSVIAGLLLSIPLFSLFMQLNPQHPFSRRINISGPGYQSGMVVGVFVALAAFVVTWISLHNLAKKRAASKAIKTAEKEAARAAKEAEKAAERAAEEAERAAKQAERDAKKAAKRGVEAPNATDLTPEVEVPADFESAAGNDPATGYGAATEGAAGDAPPARPH